MIKTYEGDGGWYAETVPYRFLAIAYARTREAAVARLEKWLSEVGQH